MNYVQSKAGELEKYKADFDELEKGNVWLFNWKKFVLYVPEDISYLLLCFLIIYLKSMIYIYQINTLIWFKTCSRRFRESIQCTLYGSIINEICALMCVFRI